MRDEMCRHLVYNSLVKERVKLLIGLLVLLAILDPERGESCKIAELDGKLS